MMPCAFSRFVDSIRRYLLDHVVVPIQGHLRRLLSEYAGDYNDERDHTSLQDSPVRRPVESRPAPGAEVVATLRIDGLQHRHVWREAL